MYPLKDVSVIIPTFNRADDLAETLTSFKEIIPLLKEVIIIDQSTNAHTKELIRDLKSKKIQYVYSSPPSLTRARNVGISHLSPDTKVALFLDDDVTLEKGYFEALLRVFNEQPEALGVSGYYLPSSVRQNRYEAFLRKIFLIEHLAKDTASVLSAFGAVYPLTLSKTISAQWLPGFNMAFKKEVVDKQTFDENLSRYSLAEDFDFTYRVYLSRPRSLYITPEAKLLHRVSMVERYPAKKSSYMNQIHHVYLNYKDFNGTVKEKFSFIWTLVGITLLRMIRFVGCPSFLEGLKLRFYFSSLFYCLHNLKNIRRGMLEIPAGVTW